MKIKFLALTILIFLLSIFQTGAIGDGAFPVQNEKREDNSTYRPNIPNGIEVYELSKDEAIRLAYKAARAAGYDSVTVDAISDTVVIINENFFMGDAKAWIQPILIKNQENNETGVFFETHAEGIGFNFSLIPSYVIGGYKSKFDELVKQENISLTTFQKYKRINENITQKIFKPQEKKGNGLSGHVLSANSRVCNMAWDAERLMQVGQEEKLDSVLQLTGAQSIVVDSVTVAQLQAFYEANESISKLTDLSPSFIVCDGKQPNAFAFPINNALLVGVTIGMLKLVDGDRDMAGMVIGHEYAHHIKRHLANAQARNNVLGALGLIAGSVMENKIQHQYNVKNVGHNLGQLGAILISRKFSRDDEIAADSEGLKYMMNAGFSPSGALRLTEKMNSVGGGGIGLFFDTHPGWDERTNRFNTIISQNSEAQSILATLGDFTPLGAHKNQKLTAEQQKLVKSSETISIQGTYETTDAEKTESENNNQVKSNKPAQIRVGTSSFTVEQLARGAGCALTNKTELLSVENGVEAYKVDCKNKEPMMFRC